MVFPFHYYKGDFFKELRLKNLKICTAQKSLYMGITLMHKISEFWLLEIDGSYINHVDSWRVGARSKILKICSCGLCMVPKNNLYWNLVYEWHHIFFDTLLLIFKDCNYDSLKNNHFNILLKDLFIHFFTNFEVTIISVAQNEFKYNLIAINN